MSWSKGGFGSVHLGLFTILAQHSSNYCSVLVSSLSRLICSFMDFAQELEIYMQLLIVTTLIYGELLCCSRDCPIFYRRKKAQKDMAEARLQLDRWNF